MIVTEEEIGETHRDRVCISDWMVAACPSETVGMSYR